MKNLTSFSQFSKADLLFLLIIGCFLTFAIFHLPGRLEQMEKIRQKQAYPFVGLQFSRIKDIVHPFPSRIGYMTDKNLSDNIPGMVFSQAQYVLAPAVLDLNGVHHKYILLDYSDKKLLAKIAERHHLVPLKQTHWGIILAINPEVRDE